MKYKAKKIIAIIPARSGSKSIKDKNIIMLLGKPLIAWSIEACLKSKLISKVFVSTDSIKYANIAKKFGPVEIIYRPKNLSTDNTTDYQMIEHAIKNIDFKYEYIAHIRPTTPLRKVSDIDLAINFFFKSNCNSLRSVHEMSETAYKSVELNNGKDDGMRYYDEYLDEFVSQVNDVKDINFALKYIISCYQI